MTRSWKIWHNFFTGCIEGGVSLELAATNAAVVFAGGYDFNAVFVARGNAGSEYVFTGTPGRFGGGITSETAACLTVAESGSVSNCVAFAGGVGLRKTAAGTMRMHGASTSTGTVEVVAGTVEFAANGSWRKARAVQIAAGATNILNNRLTYGPETRLVLADGGALALNFEGNLKLGGLVTGGAERRPGRYCAPGNSTAIRAGATAVTGIIGTGVIQPGEFGTCLIFR